MEYVVGFLVLFSWLVMTFLGKADAHPSEADKRNDYGES